MEGDVIKGQGEESHIFLPLSKAMKDFEFKGDVRINGTGNSGIFYRAHRPLGNAYQGGGYQVEIIGSGVKSTYKTGGILGKARVTENVIKDGEWFSIHIIVKGNHFVVKINDNIVTDYTDQASSYKDGFLFLELDDTRTIIEFRNLKWKPL